LRHSDYLQRLRLISVQRNWGIQFQNGQIVIIVESLDAILTLLQNKRLHSDLANGTFDVDSAKDWKKLRKIKFDNARTTKYRIQTELAR
jgi:hypothetical protein